MRDLSWRAGAATTVAEAHASMSGTARSRFLPMRYIEAGCGQCHQNALEGTPQLNHGQNHADALRLRPLPCDHSAGWQRRSPTDHPPSLVHIADKTTREWIYSWLKDPQAFAASTTMPNYKLSDGTRAISPPTLWQQQAASRQQIYSQRQAHDKCRSRRRRQLVWSVVLRVMPCGAECGWQSGWRRRRPGTYSHRQ